MEEFTPLPVDPIVLKLRKLTDDAQRHMQECCAIYCYPEGRTAYLRQLEKRFDLFPSD